MIVVEKMGARRPLSRGILAQSIAATGLRLDRTYELALEIYGDLERQRRATISSQELEELVCHKLVERGLEREERFYRVHEALKHRKKPMMILFGGGTGVGKSTLAAELGHRLGISMVVSTDTVREIMRSMVSSSLVPTLHQSTFTVDEVAPSPLTEDPLIRGFDRQVSMVCAGLRAVMERGITECVDMVLNGVHLVPGYVDVDRARREAYLFFYVLALEDLEEHEERFLRRAERTLRAADQYLKRMDKIRRIQEFILERARGEEVRILPDAPVGASVRHIIRDMLTSLEKEVLP